MARASEAECALTKLDKRLPAYMCKDLANVVMRCIADIVPPDAYEEFDEDMLGSRDRGKWDTPERQRLKLIPTARCGLRRCRFHRPATLTALAIESREHLPLQTSGVYNVDNSLRPLVTCFSPVDCEQVSGQSGICTHRAYLLGQEWFGPNGSHALLRYIRRQLRIYLKIKLSPN
jgi:hypothetical protein